MQSAAKRELVEAVGKLTEQYRQVDDACEWLRLHATGATPLQRVENRQEALQGLSRALAAALEWEKDLHWTSYLSLARSLETILHDRRNHLARCIARMQMKVRPEDIGPLMPEGTP